MNKIDWDCWKYSIKKKDWHSVWIIQYSLYAIFEWQEMKMEEMNICWGSESQIAKNERSKSWKMSWICLDMIILLNEICLVTLCQSLLSYPHSHSYLFPSPIHLLNTSFSHQHFLYVVFSERWFLLRNYTITNPVEYCIVLFWVVSLFV